MPRAWQVDTRARNRLRSRSAAWARSPAVARQRFHERNQVEALLIRQLDWSEQGRAARAVDAALLIMAHHIGERGNRRVVHVRRAQGHRSQRRRLEGKVQRRILNFAAAALVGGGGADVVKLVIGESPAAVAGGAARLAGEKREPSLA